MLRLIFLAALTAVAAGAEPDASSALISSAKADLRAKQPENALEKLAPAVADHPDWAEGRLYVGLAHYELRRWEEALEHLEQFLVLRPEFDRARIFVGWCHFYLGRPDVARQTFHGYLTRNPGSAEAHFALGMIDFDGDRTDDARRRFEQALTLARETGESPAKEALFRLRLADVMTRLGELGQARRELERSIELDPTNRKAHFKLISVLGQLGDTEAAERAEARFGRSMQGVEQRSEDVEGP